MADTFLVTTPVESTITQDNLEKSMRTMVPTEALVDNETIKVVGDKLIVGSGVPRTRKETIGFADFTSAALVESIQASGLQEGEFILKTIVHVTEAWVIPTATTVGAEIGISADPDKYSGSSSVDVLAVNDGVIFDPATNEGLESMSAPATLEITLTSDSGNVNTATAGSLDVIYLIAGAVDL